MALLHGALTKQIIACFYEVHHELGTGFPESVYSRAMEFAMTDVGLMVQREVPLNVRFRGRIAGEFRADTLVESRVLLEYKTAVRAVEVAEAQLLGYLRCTDKEVGLLLKFFEKPSFKRLFYSNEEKDRRCPFIPRPSASQTLVSPATYPNGAESSSAADQELM